MMNDKPKGLASISDAYYKALYPGRIDMLAGAETEAERNVREAKRFLLLSQRPEDALKKIKDGDVGHESILSLHCLVIHLMNEVDTHKKRTDRVVQELKAIKKTETSPAAAVASPSDQPTKTPDTNTDRVWALLNSILVNKLSICIISGFVGVALFVATIGGAYCFLNKQGLIPTASEVGQTLQDSHGSVPLYDYSGSNTRSDSPVNALPKRGDKSPARPASE
jgi:hypothetical protein